MSVTLNPMRKISVEKVVISAGATGDSLTKAHKLLEIISGKKAQIIKSSKRIPDFDVRPGLEVGTRVTIRNEDAVVLLKRLLSAIDNKLKKKSISDNHFSFGIKEYIEIPGMEYQRDIGIRGLNATVTFARPGLRVQLKKIKGSKVAKVQYVTQDEIIQFMTEGFKTAIA
ncbi:50S ribosomal protein L5 [Candidatus Pacearchaeota archaeon]|nr:50S ribosomal protein L5 [Candidatus Pacearchaeota archaeon]